MLIKINNDAEYTNSLDVILTLSASDVHWDVGGIRVKNDSEDWTDWEPYVSDPTFSKPAVRTLWASAHR